MATVVTYYYNVGLVSNNVFLSRRGTYKETERLER